MAPLLPAPVMESNDRSERQPVARRKPSSFSAASISVSAPSADATANHAKKRDSAAPSRIWALRVPSISRLFLQALGNWQGSGARRIRAPCLVSRSNTALAAVAGSASTAWPASASSAAVKSSGARSRTPSPRCANNSGLRFFSSRKSSLRPSSCRMAKPSTKGVCGRSCPRMLCSQQTESARVITAACAPSFFKPSASRARLAVASSPARLKACGTARRIGGAGWSAQIASMGLVSSATSVAPACSQARARWAAPLAVDSQGS